MDAQQIRALIDQTMLKAQNSYEQYLEFIEESAVAGFKGICVPSYLLGDPEVQKLKQQSLLVTVIGFPLGYSTLNSKVFEAEEAAHNGADEVDYVLNISKLKAKDWTYIEEEMKAIKVAAQVPVKVIIETAYLDQAEKRKACELVKKTGLAFIKTSTGFAGAGAQLEDIKLFKEVLEGQAQIKASGGIKTLEDLLLFHQAGADRIGTSSGKSILEAL